MGTEPPQNISKYLNFSMNGSCLLNIEKKSNMFDFITANHHCYINVNTVSSHIYQFC